MHNIGGKHFSITDPKDVKTVIYKVNETEKELQKNAPKYTIERLDSSEEIRGENIKRTYFVDNPTDKKEKILILSFGRNKVVINNGIVESEKVKISKKPMPFVFDTLYTEKETEYKEFSYTPNLKRPISIIDPETTEEIKPIVYIDKNTNELRGKCKLKPYKSYFVFEIRDENGKFKLLGGSPKLEEQ